MCDGTTSALIPLVATDSNITNPIVSIRSMAHMFHGASNFNQKLNHFVTNSVKDFRYMFYNAKNFNRDISNWNLQSAWYLNNMFGSADAFAADFSRDLCNWGYYADTFLNVNNMFANTDCPDTDNPNLTAVTPGPFCYRCPTTCVPVAACVPQIWTACSITPPCNLTSTCFTTAVQGCCTNGKPSTLYAQQVRDAYAGEHCKDVVCQTPAKCAASIWDNCEPLCNTAYKCFQNGVKRCCTDALPNATYIARVTGTYSKTFCKCNPMPTDPVKVCALEVKSQCHVGQPGCQMNSTCFHNVTSACCRNETSLADFATHVKQETQNLCRGCTPPLHPIAACVRQVRRTCRTCRLRLRDDCVRGVVMKCCLPGPPRLWMDTIRDRYRRKYCTTPSPVRT